MSVEKELKFPDNTSHGILPLSIESESGSVIFRLHLLEFGSLHNHTSLSKKTSPVLLNILTT